MKSLLDIVLGLVGLGALGYGVFEFYRFVSSPGAEGNTTHLYWAIAGFVVFCICALAIFIRNREAEPEIHITQ